MSNSLIWPLSKDDAPSARNLLLNSYRIGSSNQLFYHDSEFISLDLHFHKNKIEALLPSFLKAHPDGSGIFFVAKHKSCCIGVSYLEAGVLVKVKTIFGEGYHFLWAVVDNDLALSLGRETLGVPKKMAEIKWNDSSKESNLTIERNGEKVFELNFNRTERQITPRKIMGQRFYNVGGVASLFLLQPIWTYRAPETIRESCAVQSLDSNIFWGKELIGLIKNEEMSDTGQYTRSDIYGTRWLLPVGLAGPSWLANSFNLRYR